MIVYIQDDFFLELKDVPKLEVTPMEKEPDKIEFELEDEEYDSIKEVKLEEEETHIPILRRSSQERRKLERYSSHDFQYYFSLSITNDDPRNMKEFVDSEDSVL